MVRGFHTAGFFSLSKEKNLDDGRIILAILIAIARQTARVMPSLVYLRSMAFYLL